MITPVTRLVIPAPMALVILMLNSVMMVFIGTPRVMMKFTVTSGVMMVITVTSGAVALFAPEKCES